MKEDCEVKEDCDVKEDCRVEEGCRARDGWFAVRRKPTMGNPALKIDVLNMVNMVNCGNVIQVRRWRPAV